MNCNFSTFIFLKSYYMPNTNYYKQNLNIPFLSDHKRYELKDVLKLIEEDNFIIFIGEPGIGKSRNLKKLASLKNECKLLIAKDIKLEELKNISNKTILIDALDEMDEAKIIPLIDTLHDLRTKNELKFILSSRTSLFEKYINHFNKLDPKKVIINPFSNDLVLEIIKSSINNDFDINNLEEHLNENGLLDKFRLSYYPNSILNTPRYLFYFIELLKENKIKLDETTRKDILLKVIDKRFSNEISDKVELKDKYTLPQIKQIVERLALIMSIKGTSKISLEDYWEIAAETEILGLQQQLNSQFLFKHSIIKVTDDYLEFDNEAFKEVLTASAIAKYENIYPVISEIAFTKQLNSPLVKWENTLSYLVESDLQFGATLFQFLLKNQNFKVINSIFSYTNFNNLKECLPNEILLEIIDAYSNQAEVFSREMESKYSCLLNKPEVLLSKLIENPSNKFDYHCNANILFVINEKNIELFSEPEVLKLKEKTKVILNSDVLMNSFSTMHENCIKIWSLTSTLTEIDFLKKMYETNKNDSHVNKEILTCFIKVSPDSETTIDLCFDWIINDNNFIFTHDLFNFINSEESVLNFFDVFLKKLKDKMESHKSYSDLKLNNLKYNFTDNVKIKIAEFIFESDKINRHYYNNTFFEWLYIEIIKIDDDYIFFLLNCLKKDWLTPTPSYTDNTIIYPFAQLLTLNNIKKFIKKSSEKLGRNTMFNLLYFIKDVELRTIWESEFKIELKNQQKAIKTGAEAYYKKYPNQNPKLRQIQEREDHESERKGFEQLLKEQNFKALLCIDKFNYNEFKTEIDKIVIKAINDINFHPNVAKIKNKNSLTFSNDYFFICKSLELIVMHSINIDFVKKKILIPALFIISNSNFNSIISKVLTEYQTKEIIEKIKEFSQSDIFLYSLSELLKKIRTFNLTSIFNHIDPIYLFKSDKIDDFKKNELLNFLKEFSPNEIPYTYLFAEVKKVSCNYSKDFKTNIIGLMINREEDFERFEQHLQNLINNPVEFTKAKKTISFPDPSVNWEYSGEVINYLFDLKYFNIILNSLKKSIKKLNENYKYNYYFYYNLWRYIFDYFDYLLKIKELNNEHINTLKGIYLNLEKNYPEAGFYNLKNLFNNLFSNYDELLYPTSIRETTKKYLEIRNRKYTKIFNLNELIYLIQLVLEKDLQDWFISNGFDVFMRNTYIAISQKGEQTKKNQKETFLQSLMYPIIQNLLLNKGFDANSFTLFKEAQSGTGNRRIDFLINYGIIGKIIIEVKREPNSDIKNSKNRTAYVQTLKEYLSFTNADYLILFVIRDEERDSNFEQFIKDCKDDFDNRNSTFKTIGLNLNL